MIRWASIAVMGCSFHGPAVGASPSDGAADGPLLADASPDVPGDVPGDVVTPTDLTGLLPDASTDATPDANSASCTTTNFTCASSPRVTTCNGHCWASCTEAVDQDVAQQRCAVWGGVVAEANDANDDACIANTIFGQNVASWIGITYVLPDGWEWPDGNPYTNWASGQPANSLIDACAYESTSAMWHTGLCTGQQMKWSCRI